MSVRVAGDNVADEKLWKTYLYWAREGLLSGEASTARAAMHAIVDDPSERIDERYSRALRTMLFASFVLEYRMKRVFEVMRVRCRRHTMLNALLGCFWKRLAAADRLNGKGKCQPPDGWGYCEREMRDLIKLRNQIAHANYRRIVAGFPSAESAENRATELYNAVVEALKLINIGIGYFDCRRTREDIDDYFKALKVPLPSQAGTIKEVDVPRSPSEGEAGQTPLIP